MTETIRLPSRPKGDPRFAQLVRSAEADLAAMAGIWDMVDEHRRRERGIRRDSLGPADHRALHQALEALARLSKAREALCVRLPAVDAALHGRSLVEARDRQAFYNVPCRRCGSLGDGKIVREMCRSCYNGWLRAGKPDVEKYITASS